MDTLGPHLAKHNFAALFHEELGWDRAAGSIDVHVDDRTLTLSAIAQKRGFQVLHCTTDRRVLLNRGLLRRAQRKIASTIHEHILIYSCDHPRKQVWQWAVRREDGHHFHHREHPFFSASPPAAFLDRLQGLRFLLDEEDSVILIDALDRVRAVLDVTPELNLFAKRPVYAVRSDELALAMAKGEPGAFDKFILLHRPLARHIAKRLQRWFGMDPDDAEQIGVIGLIQAARRFDPERGYQFSTYASWWVRQACQRFGPDAALMIRVPQHAFWPLFQQRRYLTRVECREGPVAAREALMEACRAEPDLLARWWRFERAMNVVSLSDRREPAYCEARRIVAPAENPRLASHHAEQAERFRAIIGQLKPRDAEIIRLRFGLEGQPQTLAQVGQRLGVTRERIRQVEKRALKRLQRLLVREMPSLRALGRSSDGVAAVETKPEAKPASTPPVRVDPFVASNGHEQSLPLNWQANLTNQAAIKPTLTVVLSPLVERQPQPIRVDATAVVETINTDPIELSSFNYAGVHYSLEKPVVVNVEYAEGVWKLRNEALNVSGQGQRRDDAIKGFQENLAEVCVDLASADGFMSKKIRRAKQTFMDFYAVGSAPAE